MPLLSDADIDERLRDGAWRREESSIVCDFEFKNFEHAMVFVNRVAELAEGANHHPDILVHGWNKVRLTLSTHSEGGLTENDFALAAKIDSAHE